MLKSSKMSMIVQRIVLLILTVITLQRQQEQCLFVVVSAAAAVTTPNFKYNVTAKLILDKTSYYPGQTMIINITRNDTNTITNTDELFIVIAPVQVPDEQLTDEYYLDYTIERYAIQWKLSTIVPLSMLVNINFIQYKNGYYTVALIKYISSENDYILLGIADNNNNTNNNRRPVRIYNPKVSIKLVKKEFFQGEAVIFTFYNPYINLIGHRFKIVTTFPSDYEKIIEMQPTTTSTGTTTTNSSSLHISKSLIVPYDQDEYKIILERYVEYPSYDYPRDVTIKLCDVLYSTFTIKRNYPTLEFVYGMMTNKEGLDSYQNYFDHVSLTTMNNIPLTGPYTVELVFANRSPFSSTVMQLQQGDKPTMMLNASLNNVIYHEFDYIEYRARIMIDQKVWAISSTFITT